MPFDPKAFLAAGAAPSAAQVPAAFDPGAFLQATAPEPEEAPQRAAPGGVESFLRGAKQGLTFGFGDEISGALESAFTDKTYQQARDEARENDRAAQGAHPWLYAGGNVAGGVAGSLVPGLGIVKGAGLAANVGRAAFQGALQGAGDSEASDIGGGLADVAQGAITGGAGGAIAHGVGKWLAGAPGRVDDRLVQGVTEGAKPNLAEKLVGRAGNRRPAVLDAIKSDVPLRAAIESGDAEAMGKAVGASRTRVGEALGEIWGNVDAAAPKGVPVKAMMMRLNTARDELLRAPETQGQAKAVWGEMKSIWDAWGERGSVPAKELRKTISGLQEDARAYYRAVVTGGVAPDAASGKKLAADSLRDLLNEHVESVAAAHPEKVGATLRDLKALNSQYSILADLQDVADTKLTREAKVPPKRLGWMFDVGLMLTDPTAFVAKKVLLDTGVGGGAVRAVDSRLAQLVEAAAHGSRGADLKLYATKLGLGAAAAQMIESKVMRMMKPPAMDADQPQ